MQVLSYLPLVRNAGSIGGAIMLSLVIWFYGPALKIDRYFPLERADVRAILIGLVLLLVGGTMVLRIIRRRRAARALEGAITAPMADDSDVLSARMKDALATLRTSRASAADALYSLPWYIIIGPPGAGKTTALVNSRLKFPLTAGGAAGVVEGVGGTRYCDWWFTEEAVLIDTAGRYTTQDSGSETASEPNLDRRSWLAFLGLLKKHRPRQPINGVIVAFGVDDLVALSEDERAAHADAIRTRLVELHDQLRITFPVYVMFTKADLVEGFAEFFGDLREKERQIVWGATFQTDDRTKNTVTEVPAELDALILRLSENLLDRLQAEPNQARRSAIFGFPAQFNALRIPLVGFLARIFEPTRYHSTAILRGFYFTSGTQEGTTLDQLIGATARAVGGAEQVRMSGKGRSFFIHDLLAKVIFGEAGWVSTNRAAVRRARIARAAGLAIVVAAVGLSLAGFAVSYAGNSRLISSADAALEEVRVRGGDLVGEVEIRSPDLDEPQRDVLWPMRTLPAGYASSDEPTPLTEGFGLSQRGHLNAAATETYHRALERSFRSRLVLRVEAVLQANLDDPVSTYQTLKVYRMLTGERPDDDIIAAWVVEDWERNVYPGPLNSGGRQALRAHLDAMLALDDGRDLLVEPNAPLVQEAERVLARIPLADAAYARLRQEAGADAALYDWRLVDAAGADAEKVFSTLDGSDLAAVSIPAFFTADGFQRALLNKLVRIEQATAAEEWLIGAAAKQPAFQAQYRTLKEDVLARYQADTIAVWRSVLDNLALKPLAADKPRYVALRAISAPASPLRQLVESVTAQTALTRAPEPPPGGEGEAAPIDPTAPLVIADAAASRDAVRTAVRAEPGSVVEAAFVPIHQLTAEGAEPSIGGIVAALDEIHDRLVVLGEGNVDTAADLAAANERIAALRAEAARLPDPVSRLVLAAVRDLDGDTRGTRADQIAKRFNVELTEACSAIVDNRYPFFADSARDVGMDEFARLFRPDGVIDAYRKANLDPYIDRDGGTWRWSESVAFSNATLAMFARAAEITAAFFPDGKETPNVAFVVTTLGLDPRALSGVLKINENYVHATGATRTVTVPWPGETPTNDAAVAVSYGAQAETARIGASGPWALLRLVAQGRSVARDGRLNVDFAVAGRTVSFAFAASSGENPLTLRALSAFRCPTGL